MRGGGGRKRERVKGWKKVGGREWCSRAAGSPSLSAAHDFLAASRSVVALHRASWSFNEEFELLLVSPLVRPRRFYAIRRRSRVLLHPRSRIFFAIHRTALLDTELRSGKGPGRDRSGGWRASPYA